MSFLENYLLNRKPGIPRKRPGTGWNTERAMTIRRARKLLTLHRACEKIEMPSPRFGCERHSREGACERIGIAGFWKTPQRHSRAGGNPFIKLEQAIIWVPASAGTTLRPDLARISTSKFALTAGFRFDRISASSVP
jgi:hypothetical protein